MRNGGVLLPVKALYAVFISVDLLIVVSAVYRYPLAAFNGALELKEIISKGIFLTLARPGETTLVIMVILFVLMITSVSGLLLPLFAPGAITLLCIYAFLEG
jgi:uncharacterized membrane protein YesL